MKTLNNALILLSMLGSLPIGSHTLQNDAFPSFHMAEQHEIECPCNKERKKGPHRVIIENIGQEVIKDYLPVSTQRLYTLKSLSTLLEESEHPIRTLYTIWTNSVSIVDSKDDNQEINPLHMINYRGACSKDTYVQNFAKLCKSLHIDVRPANISERESYDFCYDGHRWEYFDPLTRQFYLSYDNEHVVSSEEILEDPLLLLRTKHNRITNEVNFNENWKELAQYEIAYPHSEEEISVEVSAIKEDVVIGFDLFPNEALIYYSEENVDDNQPQNWFVEHLIDLETRQSNGSFLYHSPFPIKEISNNSSARVILVNLDITLEAGESYILPESMLFDIEVVADDFNHRGILHVISTCPSHFVPTLSDDKELSKQDDSLVRVLFLDKEKNSTLPTEPLAIVNVMSIFDFCSPFFQLEAEKSEDIQQIRWQISSEPNFECIPSNFEQVQAFDTTITLSPICETFLNNGRYFFRMQVSVNGVWSDWSEAFEFLVKKPDPVENIEFNKLKHKAYEISWESAGNDEQTEYLVFGSNSLDFIPSIYCASQVNGLVDGEVVDVQDNNNLKHVTKEKEVIVDGSLAYYRIIARRNNQLSVPSELIHVYDHDLSNPRDVLQFIETGDLHVVAKRVRLNADEDIDIISSKKLLNHGNELFEFNTHLKNGKQLSPIASYVKSQYVSDEIWEKVKPHLLPDNHPIKSRLDRIFGAARVVKNSESVKKAGFKNFNPRRVSHIVASPHARLQGYYIKMYLDNDVLIKDDWKRLMTRIVCANDIRNYVVQNNKQSKFKVPHKWLYPLPENPSPPSSSKFLRKNFILIAEDMRVHDVSKNNKLYKSKMTKELLTDIFRILNRFGLWDSVYPFNMPYSKDGKIAFIDTEKRDRWPVPFRKLAKYLSSDMQKVLEQLIRTEGNDRNPTGV